MKNKDRIVRRSTTAAAVFVAVFCASCFGVEFRRAQNTLDDVFAASCRVNVAGARGSGTFNGEKDGLAYISTNYHVVSNQKNATVDFWTNGVQQTLTGRVVWRAYDAKMPTDFALIVVDAETLKKEVDPPYVALGGSDAKPSVNSFFISSGAPKGWSVKAWRGKVLDYYNGETPLFQPHPVPGQSGSGVFEEIDGELFQVGIITWLIGAEGDDAAKGGAIPIANLYKALRKNPYQVVLPDMSTGSPIPPDAVECEKGKDDDRRNTDKDAEETEKKTEGGELPSDYPVTFLSAQRVVMYGDRPALGFSNGVATFPRVVSFKDTATAGATTFPRVVYFTTTDCAACELLEPDIQGIVAERAFPFQIVDASTEDGGKIAQEYGVDVAPTALVVDSTGKERARVSFELMKVRSPRVAIQNAYDAVVSEIEKEQPKDDRIGAPLCPIVPKEEETGATTARAGDFRRRATFYDLPPDVGFFDDSEDRWQRRGGGRFDAPKNYDSSPEKGNDDDAPDSSPDYGGSARSSRLFDRLGDRLQERLEETIKRAARDAGETITGDVEQRIRGALSGDVSKLMAGIEDGIKDKIENGAKATIRRYAWRVFWCLLLVVFLGQVVFSIFRRVCASFWSKVLLTVETLVATRENLLTLERRRETEKDAQKGAKK